MSDEPDDDEISRADRIRSGRKGRRPRGAQASVTSGTSGTSVTSETEETSGSEGTTGTAETAGRSETSEPTERTGEDEIDDDQDDQGPWDAPLKDLNNVSFYLTEDFHADLDIAQDLVNATYRREYGAGLEANREFRPLLLDVAMEIVEEMDAGEIRDRFEDSDRLPDPPGDS